MKYMKINNDYKERAKVLCIALFQMYKIAMGSFSIIFVPMDCDGQVCTMMENYEKTGLLHDTALVFNLLSFVSFMAYYYIELRRENWCVHNLDIDHDKPDNNLRKIIAKSKECCTLDDELFKYNQHYIFSVCATVFVYALNFIFSTMYIYDHSMGSSTWNTYLSFSILIFMKLFNSFHVGYTSYSSFSALSAYMTEFSSFNVIDVDVIEKYGIHIDFLENGEGDGVILNSNSIDISFNQNNSDGLVIVK